MTAGIRWRLPDSAPADYPAIKRFVDAWFCDPRFAGHFRDDPASAIEGLGLDLDPSELEHLVAPGQVELLTDPLREGAAPAPGDLAQSWRSYAVERYRAVGRERGERSPSCPSLANWRWQQMARLKFELAPSSAGQIRHIPFAIELTKGCSGRCWFCGISAKPLTGVFERTEENIALFRGLLSHLHEVFGHAASSDGILYWATDPIDHPEYEAFVDDFAEIVGLAPSTVTALAGRNPERAASILETLSRYPARSHRFSLVSPKDYRTVVDRFDPDELASVELLPQFRKDLSLKFSAGRARDRMPRTDGASSAREGTIACLSGLLIDMVGRTVRIVTPCPSSDDRPDGIHESTAIPFQDLADGVRVVDELLEDLRISIPADDAVLQRSQGVIFEDATEDNVARIHSPHHAIRVRVPVAGDLLESALPIRGTTETIFDAIDGFGRTDPVETLSFIRLLLDAGVYRRRLPGEGEVAVPLGISSVTADRLSDATGPDLVPGDSTMEFHKNQLAGDTGDPSRSLRALSKGY